MTLAPFAPHRIAAASFALTSGDSTETNWLKPGDRLLMPARYRTVAFAMVLALVPADGSPASAETSVQRPSECFSEDNERRIAGCSDLIATPGLATDDLALAYAMRALAYSLKAAYPQALSDYDEALRLRPEFPIALNNRAWALYKSGDPARALPDVERALALSPGSPHALDTRAHIRHLQGEARAALADYELAMRFGGERMIKLYQCGLQARGLYQGGLDGRYTADLRTALQVCVNDRTCDPLPADEECRRVTS